MRICISSTAFLPYEHNRGISNTVFLITKVFRDKFDIDVSVYTPEGMGMKKEEEFNGVKIKRFQFMRVMTDWTVSAGLYRALKNGGFDIIHSFHYGYFPATAGFFAAKASNAPHVLTTSYHPGQSTLFKVAMMKIYNKVHGQFLLKDSLRVLPQNIDELNHLRSITDFRYDVVPCPVNDGVFYPSDNKSGKTTVLFVGNLVPWKGADVAFGICKALERERNDVRFVFIGEGMLEKSLRKRAGKNFTFLKNLPQSMLGRCVRSADIFLYPTQYESFGRVVAEAEMCGLPVVSTRVGAIPETVGGGGFVVDYGNWQGMKERVEMLVEDAELRKRTGKKAEKHARQFKDDVVASRIYKVYKEALSS